MTILDFILLFILFFFVMTGFRFGLIITLGSLLGTVVGVLIAGNYFESGALMLNGIFLGNENLARVVSFIIIFVLASRLVGLVFWIIDKFFKVLAVIPFLKSVNRLAGGLLGFLEGAVVIGVSLLFIDKFPFSDVVIPAVQASDVAQWLLGYGEVLAPLLPDAVKLLESNIQVPDAAKNLLQDKLQDVGISLPGSAPTSTPTSTTP